ncbi:MAG: single-stranded-DNA-specific exonuclease RecJ [Candidatus Omnitrophota bacterium]|jgi:single-stranded-DNA-specific exonuclease|nr:MAG: single-stranded-DNA-specific exonuclease RecJ [Candidatus Omnitrophota bacterium]
MQKTWQLKPIPEEKVPSLSASLGISPFLTRLLLLRGLETPSDINNFLSPDIRHLFSPFLFSEMRPAVDRILRAAKNHERILIHGDYDVDGITGTCILLETLWNLGIEADYYLPDRLKEGYGLQPETIRSMASEYNLLITVDCGTTAVDSIQRANELGLDVIVTDHHDPGSERPPALAVINPVRNEESYPFRTLSGSTVAWKLASALRMASHHAGSELEQLEIAVLGLVADIMPLQGENRTLFCLGQNRFEHANRPGLSALMELAKVHPQHITPHVIGFQIAPRLNAAGRMEHPRLALELLLTQDETHGWELAQQLQELNNLRKRTEQQVFEAACGQVRQNLLDQRSDRLLMITGRDWHRGVLGTVAQRLVQQFGKPVFLFSLENDTAIASIRSSEGANLIPLLHHVRAYTLSCGGHATAAGVKCKQDQLAQLETALYEAGEREWSEQRPSPLRIDTPLPLEQIDENLMTDLSRLEPFGSANDEPLFYTKTVLGGYGAKIVGNNHLRLTFQHPRGLIHAIGFGLGSKLDQFDGSELEIAFHCRYNEYQGRREIQLYLRDIRPTTLPSSGSISSRPPANSISQQSHIHSLTREKLGNIYRLLNKTANESLRIPREHSYLLAQLEKISKTEFTLALKIFVELDLVHLEPDQIIMKKVAVKKDLSDSPTFRSLQQRNTLSS